jgi:hypothetical protein
MEQRGGYRTPLHIAVANDNLDDVNKILSSMSDDEKKVAVNTKTNGGKTPLTLLIKTQDESETWFGHKKSLTCKPTFNTVIFDALFDYSSHESITDLMVAAADCKIPGAVYHISTRLIPRNKSVEDLTRMANSISSIPPSQALTDNEQKDILKLIDSRKQQLTTGGYRRRKTKSRRTKSRKTKRHRKTRSLQRAKSQRGGMFGWSNNDRMNKLLTENPSVDITQICKDTNEKLKELFRSLADVQDKILYNKNFTEIIRLEKTVDGQTPLQQFATVRGINHIVKEYIEELREPLRAAKLGSQRTFIMNQFRDNIEIAISET